MTNVELLDQLSGLVINMEFEDTTELDYIKKRINLYIKKMFNGDEKYANDIKRIPFESRLISADRQEKMRVWEEGRQRLINVIKTMQDEIRLFSESEKENDKTINEKSSSRKVFVVHGHDQAMKESVARCLDKLELEPIILHERSDQGRNVLQKLQDESSDVSFAVVLLSGDDTCIDKNNPSNIKTRARQNVILELGYFIGVLGNKNVLTLFNPENNFEMPTDYAGILYTEYDFAGNWRFKLAKELKESGLNIDVNKLL